MKLAILSDTHVSELAELPRGLLKALDTADMVLHAGDYAFQAVLYSLRSRYRFAGVHGNSDEAAIKAELPECEVLQLCGRRIGLTHGYGPPAGLERRVTTLLAGCDIIIYGHSHTARCEWVGGVLHLNPGTSGDRFTARWRTYGIIDISDRIDARIERLS